MLQAFAHQHLPEQTAKIEATHKEDYGKKNARLDERIDGLKKAEKTAKAEAKPKKADQPAKAGKPTTTAVAVISKTATIEPQAPPTAGTIHIVTVPPKVKTAEVTKTV